MNNTHNQCVVKVSIHIFSLTPLLFLGWFRFYGTQTSCLYYQLNTNYCSYTDNDLLYISWHGHKWKKIITYFKLGCIYAFIDRKLFNCLDSEDGESFNEIYEIMYPRIIPITTAPNFLLTRKYILLRTRTSISKSEDKN